MKRKGSYRKGGLRKRMNYGNMTALGGYVTPQNMANIVKKTFDSYVGGAEGQKTNSHTAQQLHAGIDEVRAMYARKKKSKKQRIKSKYQKKKRLKAKRRILKLIREPKCLNTFYEHDDDTVDVSYFTTNITAEQYLLNGGVDDKDHSMMLFTGDAWGTTTDVNNIITKMDSTGWVHTAVTQNQLKKQDIRAYVKSVLKGAFVPQAPSLYHPYGFKFDVYECVAAQDIVNALYNTPDKAWIECLNQTETFQGSARLVSIRKGTTPFDCPRFGEWWKILNVTRHLTSASGTPVEFAIHQRGLVDSERYMGKYCIKGKTKALLVVFHPVEMGADPTPTNHVHGYFRMTRIHRYYSANSEESITGVQRLAVTNAVTQSL